MRDNRLERIRLVVSWKRSCICARFLLSFDKFIGLTYEVYFPLH